MKILKFPNESLFLQTEQVTVFETELKVLLDTMYRTMQAADGLGLAANQVGLKFRMFVMQTQTKEKIYAVNPKIKTKSEAILLIKEGCLSAPGEFFVTGSRAVWVMLEYQDETGKNKTKVLKGLDAVCAQHELEHLEGLSFMDSPTISRKTRKELAKRWGIKIR